MIWQWHKDTIKDYCINHSKDIGRLYCEILMNTPKAYKEFMDGFYEEFNTKFRDDGK